MREEHSLLAKADPGGEKYFTSSEGVGVRQVIVTTLDAPSYTACFGNSNSSNPVGTSFIFLNRDRLRTPALKATAISHELVHVEHGDPASPLGQHTVLRHLLQAEEAEAHARGLETAQALHTSLPYPVWEDRLVWIDTVPVFLELCLLNAALFVVSFRTPRTHIPPSTPREAWLASFERDIIKRVGFFVADVLGRLSLDPNGGNRPSPLHLSTFPSLKAAAGLGSTNPIAAVPRLLIR